LDARTHEWVLDPTATGNINSTKCIRMHNNVPLPDRKSPNFYGRKSSCNHQPQQPTNL